MLTIPQFLYNEAMDYYNSLYEPDPKARLFYFTKNFLIKDIKRVAKLAGLEPIRVHDIRHPYVKSTTKKYKSTKIEIPNYQECQLIIQDFCFPLSLSDNREKYSLMLNSLLITLPLYFQQYLMAVCLS